MLGTNQLVSSGNATLLFTNVTSAGVTSVTSSTSPPEAGTGLFSLNGTYYDIITTSTFSGTIDITIKYDPSIPNSQAIKLKIYHFDTTLNTWVDVTKSVSLVAKTITGTVTSLSPFAVGIPSINFLGFLPPIISNKNNDFKLGSTIPIKFQLVDGNGIFVTNATASIFVANVSDDGIVGTEQEAVSKSNNGNIFRYDSTDNQYIFNLDTNNLSKGKWRIRVALDDGTSYIAAQILLSDKDN